MLTHEPSIVIMVVGAGRGPLVEASIRAVTRAGRKAKYFAIEKNPNAVITSVLLRIIVISYHDLLFELCF